MCMNFMNRISDVQKQLTRCKDMLTLIWHQEVEEDSQPKIKLQLRMVQSKLEEIEKILDNGIVIDK